MAVLTLTLNDINAGHPVSIVTKATKLKLAGVLGRLNGETVAALKKMLPKNFSVENLVFEGRGTGVVPIKEAADQIRILQSEFRFKHLGLNQCDIDDRDLSQLLALTRIIFLKSFSLRGNNLQGNGIVAFAKRAHNLIRLNLSNNPFLHPAEVLTGLVEGAMSNQLQNLIFRRNGLRGSLKPIADLLMNESTALNILDLSHNRLGYASVDQIMPWLRTLALDSQLRRVNLSHNGWTKANASYVNAVLRTLPIRTYLQVEDKFASHPLENASTTQPTPLVFNYSGKKRSDHEAKTTDAASDLDALAEDLHRVRI